MVRAMMKGSEADAADAGAKGALPGLEPPHHHPLRACRCPSSPRVTPVTRRVAGAYIQITCTRASVSRRFVSEMGELIKT